MKNCFKCGERKPLTEFYKHKAMADGHLNKCKACAKSDVSKHRIENIESIRAYDRERGSLPHRVEARSAYAKTDQGKAAHSRACARSRAKNPKRYLARVAVGNAVRSGKLTPLPCCVCGGTAEAHHPDYDRPLDVIWLCRKHHMQAHALGQKMAAEVAA